jgi:hypothetical protein
MIGTTPVIHALGGGGPLRLVSPGKLLATMGFTRASVAQALAQDGTSYQQSAADAPRFVGTARRLLVEGPRTNALRNPNFEGAAAPSTNPTYQGLTGTTSGVTRTIVGVGSVGGLPYLDLLLSGTASAAGTVILIFESGTGIAAANAQTWTGGVGAAVISGTGATVGAVIEIRPLDSSGTALSGATSATYALTSSLTRYTHTGTIAQAATTYVRLHFRIGVTAGVTYNEVVRLVAPQLELAPFASSLILPAAGALSATTRAADVPTFAISSALQGRGTLVGTFMLPQAAPAGVDLGLLQLDDGSDNNRLLLRGVAGGGTIGALAVSGGSVTATLTGAAVTPGTPFRAALAWGSGGVAMCLAGGAVQSAATLPAGLARLLIGHATTGLARAAFGEIGPLDFHSTRLPDATLQALTTLS